MNEGTHNKFSQSMLLGYILGKMAATAPEEEHKGGDPFHDIFASVGIDGIAALGRTKQTD